MANNNDQVQFYLFTQQNPYIEQQLFVNNATSIKRSNFNAYLGIRLVIHGYLEDYKTSTGPNIKEAYLKGGHNVNIILVNYMKAKQLRYVQMYSQNVAEETGEVIDQFIKFLFNNFPTVHCDQIYLIGHSFGCKIASVVGKLQKNCKYNTIFALDPTQILFRFTSTKTKLNPTDAKYVEVIHTANRFFNIGHSEFYPNHGMYQPHCKGIFNILCNHHASVLYFAESLFSKIGFYGTNCPFKKISSNQCKWDCLKNNCAQMGGEPSSQKRGIFYLETNKNGPAYALQIQP